MSRHVVFGTGQVGHPLVERLVADGHEVVAVNRNGHGHFAGATVVGGDGKSRAAFGDLATPLDEALATTFQWYAERAAVPALKEKS